MPTGHDAIRHKAARHHPTAIADILAQPVSDGFKGRVIAAWCLCDVEFETAPTQQKRYQHRVAALVFDLTDDRRNAASHFQALIKGRVIGVAREGVFHAFSMSRLGSPSSPEHFQGKCRPAA